MKPATVHSRSADERADVPMKLNDERARNNTSYEAYLVFTTGCRANLPCQATHLPCQATHRSMSRRSPSAFLAALLAAMVCLLLAATPAAALAPRGRDASTSITAPAPGGECAGKTTQRSCKPPCVWCAAAAVPSECVDPRDAKKLPPAIFDCR